jgi:deoxyhypusine monooxygenase
MYSSVRGCLPPSCAIVDLIISLYTSVDPAPPSSNLLLGNLNPEDVSEAGVERLRKELVDPNLPLFQRYRAMFALRNIGTPAAVDALASGFSDDSALFK